MKKLIEDFATRFYLNSWDWVAVCIALCSLCIAILSLVIAYRTFKSQKQTEKNTQPIISDTIQEYLLNQFILELLDGEISINALWHLLDDKDYKFYPSEDILEKAKIPLDIIHTEIFYGREVKHHCLKGLLDMVIKYNINISTLNSHLSNPKISTKMLGREFGIILNENERIVDTWKKNMGIIFQYTEKEYSSVFEPTIKEVQLIEDYIVEYYEGNDVYGDMLIGNVDKQKMMIFKDIRVKNLISEYENFLIEK